MAFKCAHCKKQVEDDSLNVPLSGAVCPHCKHDPTEGWSLYKKDIAEKARKVADELDLRLRTQAPEVQDAALYYLEDLVLQKRHEVSIRLGSNPPAAEKCSVCGEDVPAGEGFRIEFYDRWRSTFIIIRLCKRHQSEGLWGREFDIHMNHPNAWLIRGDQAYASDGKEEEAP